MILVNVLAKQALCLREIVGRGDNGQCRENNCQRGNGFQSALCSNKESVNGLATCPPNPSLGIELLHLFVTFACYRI